MLDWIQDFEREMVVDFEIHEHIDSPPTWELDNDSNYSSILFRCSGDIFSSPTPSDAF